MLAIHDMAWQGKARRQSFGVAGFALCVVGLLSFDSMNPLVNLLEYILVLVVVLGTAYLLISAAVQNAIKKLPRDVHEEFARQQPRGIADADEMFKVHGVERESKMDVVEHIRAASPANAKAKGELAGIVVTHVEYVVPPPRKLAPEPGQSRTPWVVLAVIILLMLMVLAFK